jgi:hypothetical protein
LRSARTKPAAREARSGEGEWDRRAEFLDELGRLDRSRAIWLETFRDLGAQEEEQNPPLNGIGVEEAVADPSWTDIMFSGESPGDERHLPPGLR